MLIERDIKFGLPAKPYTILRIFVPTRNDCFDFQ